MEAVCRNEMDWSGKWQILHDASGEERQRSNCHGMDWKKILQDNPHFFGEESGKSSYLDIPTYMRRGIRLSFFSVRS